MSRRSLSLLLSSTCLAGCHFAFDPAPPAGVNRPRATSPSAASPAPTAPAASKAPAAVEAALLEAPQDAGARAVSGTVTLDASYAFNHGLGKLLTADGQHLIGQDSASLLHQDGAGLINQDGAGLINQDGAGLINQDGAGLIHQDGAGLINQDAAGLAGASLLLNASGLIGQDAAGVVATGAGNLISKRKYAIAQAAPARTLQVGVALPVGNLEVSVIDMATGLPVSLGTDKDGREVLSVLTNAKGGFQFYLPAALADHAANFRIAGRAAEDQHLAYDFVTGADGTAAAALDEPTAAATQLLRGSFAAKLLWVLQNRQKKRFIDMFGDDANPLLKVLAVKLGDPIDAAIARAPQEGLDPKVVRGLCLRATDTILARLDLDGKRGSYREARELKHQPDNSYQTGDFVAAATLTQIRTLGNAATAKMAADPAFFDQQPFYQEAIKTKPFRPIRTVGDLLEFVLAFYLSSPDKSQVLELKKVYEALDLPPDTSLLALDNIITGLIAAVVNELSQEDGEALGAFCDAIAAGKPAADFVPDP